MAIESEISIIGSGVAGLFFAIKIAEHRPDIKISLITKSIITDSNSVFAQGGIAAVTDFNFDSFEYHIQDTLASGGFLADQQIVQHVVQSGPSRINDLIEMGMNFTRCSDSQLDLAKEGGHRKHRVVHCFDNTGENLINTLVKKATSFSNITIHENQFCIELLKTKNGKVGGINTFDTEKNTSQIFLSKIVVLATGGCGQLFKHTTNPKIATGDGISMGLKIGAMVSHLNFVQFHPTALFEPNKSRLDLITEAIRGFGAYVVNSSGRRFLFDSDSRGELATRDIVSKAIFNEIKNSGNDHVFMDFRHLDQNELERKFPTVYSNLVSKGFELNHDLIPIVPAAHYHCGGLKVNERGQTNIEGLYAIGECAETGLHGSNRLASNSLLEALVFAHDAAEYVSCIMDDLVVESLLDQDYLQLNPSQDFDCDNLMNLIKETMSTYAALNSNVEELKLALEKLIEYQFQLSNYLKNTGNSLNSVIAENTLNLSFAVVYAMLEYEEKKIM